MTTLVLIKLVLLALLLLISAFFSSAETSLFSLSTTQVEQMRREGRPASELISSMLAQPRRLIITILIGNEFINVSASALSAALIIDLLGRDKSWINLVVMVPLLLLFGEITPKSLAIRNNTTFASVQARPLAAFATLITPLRIVVRRVADLFITLLVGRERSHGNLITEDMFRTLAVEAVDDGVMDHQEAQYIAQVFDFGSMTVEDVMTPRAGVFFLEATASPEEVVAALRRTRYSKVPVYRQTRDQVVGILYARDLLGLDLETLVRNPTRLRHLLRKPLFVPETKQLSELFHDFRQRKLSLALAVDEYGGVTGLVTMEDLLESIFGEIRSPSDAPQELFTEEVKGRRYRMPGTMPVLRFNNLLGTHFDSEPAETIGGIFLHAYGELPSKGAKIQLDCVALTVTRISNNRIEEVLVERLTDEGGE